MNANLHALDAAVSSVRIDRQDVTAGMILVSSYGHTIDGIVLNAEHGATESRMTIKTTDQEITSYGVSDAFGGRMVRVAVTADGAPALADNDGIVL